MNSTEQLAGGPRLDLLRWQLGVAWALLELHLEDLTDDECLWEPCTPCWSVRPCPDGRWVADPQVPMSAPTVTTIGWSTWHIGFWWSQTYEDTFGEGRRRTPEEVCWPGDADLAVQWLARLAERWERALDGLAEADLESTERSGWFLRGTRPLGYVIAWANTELMKSAAEIGAARRLYACRHQPDRLAS